MIILAADVGGTTIKLGLVSDGDLLATHSLPAKADLSMINRLEAMARSWESLLTDLNLTTKDLDGVGLALPFLIEPDSPALRTRRSIFRSIGSRFLFTRMRARRVALRLTLSASLRIRASMQVTLLTAKTIHSAAASHPPQSAKTASCKRSRAGSANWRLQG